MRRGYETLVTHVFLDGDKYLDSDVVFGVKDSLIRPLERQSAGHGAGRQRDGPGLSRSCATISCCRRGTPTMRRRRPSKPVVRSAGRPPWTRRSPSSEPGRRGCCSRGCCTFTASPTSCWSGGAANTCSAASAPACWSRARSRSSRRRASAERLHREGLVHRGIEIAFGGARHRIDFAALVGGAVTVYGQTEVTRDLMDALAADGVEPLYEAEALAIAGLDGAQPTVTYRQDGDERDARREFVAGCDGYHGVSRAASPPAALTTYERAYPFGWLGVLAETPPVSRRAHLRQPRARLRALQHALARAEPLLRAGAARDDRSRTGPTSASGTSCAAASTRRRREASSPARRSRRASRRSAASSPSRCASAGCSWPATPPTSCRRPAPRA